jgi:hypothetical protein
MAQISQGAVVYLSTTTALSTAKAIGNVVGWNGPSAASGEIDITCLASTAKEFLIGLSDSGSITFDCFFDSSDAGQIAARKIQSSRTKGHWAIKLPSLTTKVYQFDGKGYVKTFGVTGKVDGAVGCSIAIRVSGGVNLATVA